VWTTAPPSSSRRRIILATAAVTAASSPTRASPRSCRRSTRSHRATRAASTARTPTPRSSTSSPIRTSSSASTARWAFKFISKIACRRRGRHAVLDGGRQAGVAYVLFTDQRLYRVGTATGACIGTSFQPNQQGFANFGWGTRPTMSDRPRRSSSPARAIRTRRPRLASRASTPPTSRSRRSARCSDIARAELTGRRRTTLCVLHEGHVSNVPPSYIGEINTPRARGRRDGVPHGRSGQRLGVRVLGGDFYMFTGPAAVVGRHAYRPLDGSVSVVATLPTKVVGAGSRPARPRNSHEGSGGGDGGKGHVRRCRCGDRGF